MKKANLGLLGLMIVAFVVKPNILSNAFDSFLGRIVLIAIVVHFSKNNMFLGLFVALFLILGINVNNINIVGVEGFETAPAPRTVGDDTQPGTKTPDEQKIKVLTNDAAKMQMGGPIQSKPSEIPLPANMPVDVEDVLKNVNEKKKVLMDHLKELAKKYNLCELCNTENGGVDRQTVEESIRPIKPSSIPVSKNDFKSSDNVAPSDKAVEAFSGMCETCI
jgi:hypothetical protein